MKKRHRALGPGVSKTVLPRTRSRIAVRSVSKKVILRLEMLTSHKNIQLHALVIGMSSNKLKLTHSSITLLGKVNAQFSTMNL